MLLSKCDKYSSFLSSINDLPSERCVIFYQEAIGNVHNNISLLFCALLSSRHDVTLNCVTSSMDDVMYCFTTKPPGTRKAQLSNFRHTLIQLIYIATTGHNEISFFQFMLKMENIHVPWELLHPWPAPLLVKWLVIQSRRQGRHVAEAFARHVEDLGSIANMGTVSLSYRQWNK